MTNLERCMQHKRLQGFCTKIVSDTVKLKGMMLNRCDFRCVLKVENVAVGYTFNFVADTVDFVASVYGAKTTRSTLSTFNKVDRVEFNFVASVYRALRLVLCPRCRLC